MQHGVKKQKKKVLTEEEIKAINDKKNKILKINAQILQKKASTHKIEDLTFLSIAAELSSDFYTIWNYRKEIITSEILTQPNPQVIKFVQSELKLLQKLILKDPKSYCLWYHRQWCIVEGIKKEEDIINSAIIKNEQELCAMMLTKDERNFHCWSYKIWLLDTYCNEIKRRDIPNKEEILKDIYKREYDQCIKIVNKNFMNYSGWFYLGKLYRYVFPDPVFEYSPIEQHSQMDLILKALYTDPKSEGLWSVFYWLVDVIRPISV